MQSNNMLKVKSKKKTTANIYDSPHEADINAFIHSLEYL